MPCPLASAPAHEHPCPFFFVASGVKHMSNCPRAWVTYRSQQRRPLRAAWHGLQLQHCARHLRGKWCCALQLQMHPRWCCTVHGVRSAPPHSTQGGTHTKHKYTAGWLTITAGPGRLSACMACAWPIGTCCVVVLPRDTIPNTYCKCAYVHTRKSHNSSEVPITACRAGQHRGASIPSQPLHQHFACIHH